MKKYCKTNDDVCMALLQINSIPLSPWLPSLATLLFKRLARGLLPKFNRPPILCDNDENNYMTFVNRQSHAYVDADIHKIFLFCLKKSYCCLSWRCRTLDTWNSSGAQQHKLQIMGNKDGMHNQKNQETCKEHPNHRRGQPRKWDVKGHLTKDSAQIPWSGRPLFKTKQNKQCKDNETDESDMTKSTHGSKQQIVQLPKSINTSSSTLSPKL